MANSIYGVLQEKETLNATLGLGVEYFKGEQGKQGEKGADGYTPIKGVDYFTDAEITDIEEEIAANVQAGVDGDSAYEIAVKNGFTGTEEEWLASLKGKDGKNGTNGKDGIDGVNGKDGVSPAASVVQTDTGATVIIVSGDITYTANLTNGADGKDGINGIDGVNGKDGAPGANGKDGLNGKDGKDGADGATPVKGVDYFTPTEIAAIETGAAAKVDLSDYAKSADLSTVATTGSYNDLTNKPAAIGNWIYTEDMSNPAIASAKSLLVGVRSESSSSGYAMITITVKEGETIGNGERYYYTTTPYTGTPITRYLYWNGSKFLSSAGSTIVQYVYYSTNTDIADIVDFGNYYTKAQVDTKIAAIPAPDLSAYALKTDIPDVSGKANSADLSTVATTGSYNDLSDKPVIPVMPDLSGYATTDALTTGLDKKVNKNGDTMTGALTINFQGTDGQQTGLATTGNIVSGSPVKTTYSIIGSIRKCAGDGDNVNTALFLTNNDGSAKFCHKRGVDGIKAKDDAYMTFDATGFKVSYSGTKGVLPTVSYDVLDTNTGYTKTEIDSKIGDIETLLAAI